MFLNKYKKLVIKTKYLQKLFNHITSSNVSLETFVQNFITTDQRS